MAIDINNLGSGNNTRTESRGKAKAETSVTPGSSSNAQVGSNSSASSDSVQLTDTATKLRQLESNLADLPVADESRVASVKKAIADGSYNIDTKRIATKMLNFERYLG